MKKIRSFMENHHMVTKEDYIIAGISGGADSVCLFFVLLELRMSEGIGFTAVHVNHGLRGGEADRDESFVRNLCGKYVVPLEVLRINLESIAKKRKQSLEEAGRIVRREAFEAAGKKYGGTKIALAHHQNDNAETLLWNLSRGTGLHGLGGIRPVNGNYIRPLLCMSRAEIEAVLRKKNQDYCTDETNADTKYMRNKLRHLVIPVLESEINSRAVFHMNETMEELREVQDYMDAQAEKAYRKCVAWFPEIRTRYKEDGTVSGDPLCLIRQEAAEEYPAVLCRMLLRKTIRAAAGKMQDVGRVHICALQNLFEKQTGRSLDLPFSLKAVRTYEGVELRTDVPLPEAGTLTSGKEEGELPKTINVPGETRLTQRDLTIRSSILQKNSTFSMQEIPEKAYTKWFDYDIIKTIPCIRRRKSGDYITIDSAGHRQKLKSWFVNNKIPARERDSMLCIADGSEIVWILGYRMSSAYQVGKDTRRILQIEIVEEKEETGAENSEKSKAKSKEKKNDGGTKDGRDDSGAGIRAEGRSENRGDGKKDQ